MLTDAQPRKTNRAGFLESDRIKTLDLPQDFWQSSPSSTKSLPVVSGFSLPDPCEFANTGRANSLVTTAQKRC